eukprot:Amastigsp_a678175_41.p5 type:complete len:112 gc:universal Amastigsp_a678175_41:438-773(+)
MTARRSCDGGGARCGTRNASSASCKRELIDASVDFGDRAESDATLATAAAATEADGELSREVSCSHDSQSHRDLPVNPPQLWWHHWPHEPEHATSLLTGVDPAPEHMAHIS